MFPPNNETAPHLWNGLKKQFIFLLPGTLTHRPGPAGTDHVGSLTLNLASHRNSPARSTKSTTSHAYGALSACKLTVSGSVSLPSRGSFHLSLTVLFAIGHMVVFSLTGWSPCLPSGFLVSRRTLDSALCLLNFDYGIVTLFDLPFNVVRLSSPQILAVRTPHCCGLGCSDFARHYFRNRFYFLFLRVLRCFSSPGSLPRTYGFSAG